MIPITLYIHIPWCIKKCPYCDFNSHVAPTNLPEKEYINALIADLEQDIANFGIRPVNAIFIGGGTPSLFSPESYEELFLRLKNLLPFTDNIEITLEANPGTVEQDYFQAYHALGINRLSLGIQSFNNKHLKLLGRIHDSYQAERAINVARAAGFININLDLMYGLPMQSVAEGIEDLQKALAYNPEHLSWYQLTVEPNTVFYKKLPANLPSEDSLSNLENQGLSLLTSSGLHRYEISAYCRDRIFANHNLNYWLFGDYYGIGAGAHGKITVEDKLAQNIRVWRTIKFKQPKDYLNLEKLFLHKKYLVDPEELTFEFMLNVTRLEQNIPINLFQYRTGLDFAVILSKLSSAKGQGLVNINNNSWQVTSLGRRYTNDLQALFLPA